MYWNYTGENGRGVTYIVFFFFYWVITRQVKWVGDFFAQPCTVYHLKQRNRCEKVLKFYLLKNNYIVSWFLLDKILCFLGTKGTSSCKLYHWAVLKKIMGLVLSFEKIFLAESEYPSKSPNLLIVNNLIKGYLTTWLLLKVSRQIFKT